MPDVWQASIGGHSVELRLTPSGQIGVFPEQEPNWRWVAKRVGDATRAAPDTPPAVLDLFAYTGLGTLAAARAGAAVTHVDAAKNLLAWARHNATLSGLGDVPIRWIAEDAPTFVAREGRRGRRYDGLILDPPSYGHGTGSRTWRLERDLPDLLRACGRITPQRPAFLLLTCHTPGIGADDLADLLGETWRLPSPPERFELGPTAGDGRRLASGVAARWPSSDPST
jgi:23S rRNA (cytosine1962-C5)-methyltransferase